MKRTWMIALVSLSCGLACVGGASAFGLLSPYHPHSLWNKHNRYVTQITVRPYNAFTPIAWGNLVCDGCVPNPCGVSMGALPLSYGVPPFAANGMMPAPPCFGDSCCAGDLPPMMHPHMQVAPQVVPHVPPVMVQPQPYPFTPAPQPHMVPTPYPVPQPYPVATPYPVPRPQPMPQPYPYYPQPMPQPHPGVPQPYVQPQPMPQPYLGPMPTPNPQPYLGPMPNPQPFPGPMPMPQPNGPIGYQQPYPGGLTQVQYPSYIPNFGWNHGVPSYWYGR